MEKLKNQAEQINGNLDQGASGRFEKAKRVFESLEGNAWIRCADDTGTVPPEGFTSFNLVGGRFFYDPGRIEVLQPYSGYEMHDEEDPETKECISNWQRQGKDWTCVGIEENRYNAIFARPYMKELSISLPPNASWGVGKSDYGPVNMLNINDLEILIQPLNLDMDSYGGDKSTIEMIGDFNEAVMVDIQRKGFNPGGTYISGMMKEFVSRNPEIAKGSLFAELKQLLVILKGLGYKKIIASPSDERRKRIYQKMGMTPIHRNLLMGEIEKLERK